MPRSSAVRGARSVVTARAGFVLLAVLLSARPAFAAIEFDHAPNSLVLPLAGAPSSLVAVDLDQDGRLDIVTTDDGVTWFRGKGDGTFEAPVASPGGGLAKAVLAHLDADPWLDLVGFQSADVRVWFGDPGGTFHPGPLLDLPALSTSKLGMADIDLDGRTDLVVGFAAPAGTLRAYRGDGAGAFTTTITIRTGVCVEPFALAELSGDALVDVAFPSCGVLRVLKNAGGGVFEDVQTLPAPTDVKDLQAVDVTGDGRLDLVVLTAGALGVYAKGTDGTFAPRIVAPLPHRSMDFTVADFDGDLVRDVVVATDEGYLEFLRGHGDGTFAPVRSHVAGGRLGLVRAGDFDQDGVPDAVSADDFYTSLCVSLTRTGGRLGGRRDYAVGPDAEAVAIADLDGDGRRDVIATAGEDGLLVVRDGAPDGTFFGARQVVVGGSPGNVVCADLDGDTDLDVAVVNRTANTVQVLLNDGGGVLGAPAAFAVAGAPDDLVAADIDGDHDLDLVVTARGAGVVTALDNPGNAAFGGRQDTPVGADPRGIAAGDLNGDGRADVLVMNSGDGTISVLRAGPTGALGSRVDYPTGAGGIGVALADLDGDLDLDAVMTAGDARVIVRPGDGAGALGAPIDVPAEPANAVAVGDMDGDLVPDLGLANGNFVVLRGLGGLGFEAPRAFPVTVIGTDLALGELDGDARLDAVTGSYAYSGVSVLINRTGVVTGAPPAPAGVRLSASPNPARGPIGVEFGCPGEGGGRIELFDVTGRRVAHREFAGPVAATRRVVFDETARISPGLYLVRLTHAGHAVSRRVVRVR